MPGSRQVSIRNSPRSHLEPHSITIMLRHRITLILSAVPAFALAGEAVGGEPASVRAVVGTFCVGCHDTDAPKGGLDLASVVSEDIGRHPQVWEKVARRLLRRQMPPAGKKR